MKRIWNEFVKVMKDPNIGNGESNIEILIKNKQYGLLTKMFNKYYITRMLPFCRNTNLAKAHVNKFMIRKWCDKLVIQG